VAATAGLAPAILIGALALLLLHHRTVNRNAVANSPD